MTRNWPLVARPLRLWRGGNRAVDWALHDATSSTARYRKVTMNTASKLTLAALALTVLGTAASITPSAGGTATLSGTGALFVWVGAQVNPATNQPAGVYTASVTLTVTY